MIKPPGELGHVEPTPALEIPERGPAAKAIERLTFDEDIRRIGEMMATRTASSAPPPPAPIVLRGLPSLHRDARLAAEWVRAKADPVALRRTEKLALAPSLPSAVWRGDTGTLKTTLAVAAMREQAARGRRARFVEATALSLFRIQHGAGNDESEHVQRAIDVELLLLDDLGEDNPNAPQTAVGDVIRARYARGRPTWITTGRTADQIGLVYGASIKRRVFEGSPVCPVVVIECMKGGRP